MSSFVPLAERIVDALLESRPGLATSAGDHRFDDRLPDLSAEAVDAEPGRMLRDAADALPRSTPTRSTSRSRSTTRILTALVDRGLFELTDVREHEWNPLRHNPGPLLHALLARPFAPVEERLDQPGRPARRRTGRAGHRAGDAARRAADPRRDRGRAVRRHGRADPRRGARAAGPGARPASAGRSRRPTAAIAALDEFVGWLRAGLADRAGPGRDPRLGRRLWEARLWHTLDTELAAAEVLRPGRAQPGPGHRRDRARRPSSWSAVRPTDETVRRALDLLAAEHPDDATIVDLAQVTMDEATDFVREHDLVSLVDDPCVIQEMPEFARGVAVAYCDPPGPLETADVPTFYCIAPTPADWPPERVESFYREYNDHMIRNLTVHEAMPGHFLQLAHARRYRGRHPGPRARPVRARSSRAGRSTPRS